jgi:hypothetical protein
MCGARPCHGLLSEKQDKQGEKDSARVKAPGQQHASNDGAVIEKTQGRQGKGQPAGVNEHGNREEQNSSGNRKRL